jgi:hypothetical protein
VTAASSDINLRPAPFASIFVFGQNPFCANDGVLLDGGFHDRYLWSTGDTTSSLSVRTSGLFWVKVTATNGCSAADTVQTTAIPGPPVSITASGPLEFCEGDSVVLNGGNHVDYFWNGVLSGSSLIVRESRQVILVATDSTGCSSSDTVMVNARPSPMPRISPAIFCEGDSVTLSLPGFRSVLWSTGDTGAVLTLLNSDTITAVVVDSFGCQGMLDTTFIRELSLPRPTIGVVSGIPQTQRFASYQWYWLDTSDMSLIPLVGARGQSLAGTGYENDPNYTGFLVVEVNDGLCTGQSEPFDLATVGIASFASDFMLYPQPSSGTFYLELPPAFSSGFRLIIQDLQGRVVRDFGFMQNINSQFVMGDIPGGMYLLIIEQPGKRWSQKIIFSKKE